MSDVDVRRGRPGGPLRRLLEVRGLVGGHQVPARRFAVTARDGVRVAGSLLEGPPEPRATVILAHGFAAHSRKPAYAELADGLSSRHRVVSVDLRGHGRSGGRSGFGGPEAMDVAAVAEWANGLGDEPQVGVGVSMGATALLHAVAAGVALDALVLVSAPAWVGRTDTAPLERLDDMWRTGWKRRVFEAVSGVRMHAPDTLRELSHPADLIADVRCPVLVVHGEDDHFFPFADAEDLAEHAAGPVTVWRESRFGHAEDGLDRRFARRLGRAIDQLATDGRFPAG